MTLDRVRQCEDRALCSRIIGEYLEMPGLNLTIPQACRLWSMDREQCMHLLDALQATGFLRRSGDIYLRADAEERAA